MSDLARLKILDDPAWPASQSGFFWSQRPDCVAGHVRLELRNVVANYPFEKSLRFAGIQPNSRHRDYSRLSCGDGGYAARAECQDLSRDACADVGQSLRWQELPRFSARSKDDPAAAKSATPLLSLRWTLRAKRACVLRTPSLTGSAPRPRQRRWASAGFGCWRRDG